MVAEVQGFKPLLLSKKSDEDTASPLQALATPLPEVKPSKRERERERERGGGMEGEREGERKREVEAKSHQ